MVVEMLMALSDPLILTALQKLTEERPGEYITYEDIAARAMYCSVITVRRSTARLERAGKIVRRGGRHTGYKYSFPEQDAINA